MTDTTLVEASDEDFAALLGGWERLPNGLAPAPGGVEERPVLEMLRALSMRLRTDGIGAVRLMVAGGEVVGTCGFKAAPTAAGEVEIGYGVAPSRRRRGHATRAVAGLLAQARRMPTVRVVTAQTAVANLASQRVLSANGFTRAGTRWDPEDGELIVWRTGVAGATDDNLSGPS